MDCLAPCLGGLLGGDHGPLTMAGVRGGRPGSAGVWRGGLWRSDASTFISAWSWAGLAGLRGAGRFLW